MGEDGKERSAVVHIGSVLSDVLRSCRTQEDADLTRIWEVWNGAVGEAVAANAQPWAFKGNLLLVHVSSSTWLYQLRFMKQAMLTQVNAALGRGMITDIKFKIGSVNDFDPV